jgi:hypothetical protein
MAEKTKQLHGSNESAKAKAGLVGRQVKHKRVRQLLRGQIVVNGVTVNVVRSRAGYKVRVIGQADK